MICQLEDCTHYGCELRRKGIRLSPKVGASTGTRNWRPKKDTPPAAYGKILYDERPGGVKMPLINNDGTYVRGRQAHRERRTITSTIRRLRNSAPEPSQGA